MFCRCVPLRSSECFLCMNDKQYFSNATPLTSSVYVLVLKAKGLIIGVRRERLHNDKVSARIDCWAPWLFLINYNFPKAACLLSLSVNREVTSDEAICCIPKQTLPEAHSVLRLCSLSLTFYIHYNAKAHWWLKGAPSWINIGVKHSLLFCNLFPLIYFYALLI